MEEVHRKPLGPGHSIAGYSIIREVGRGGFGIVYEALNPVTQDRAAIKQFYPQAIASWLEGTIVVKKADDKELVDRILERFEAEAKLQFNFNHPNILRVKNFVRADNTGYLITEFIDGTSLADFLKSYGHVFPDWETFQRVMQPVTDALRYVHKQNALHRDISPDNILIEKSGRPILVDFGAAKVDLRRTPSASSIVPYKEAYAPVEQQVPAAERPEGRYTDIYALAGTMYCTLVGHPPVRAVDRALASKDPYVPVGQIAKIECPEAVYKAIDHGLALAAMSRPQTVETFMQSLGWLDGPPTTPEPSSARIVSTPAASASAGTERFDDRRRKSNWKPYALVALLIAVVGGALFQFSGGNELSTPTPPPRSSSATSAPSPAPTPPPPSSTATSSSHEPSSSAPAASLSKSTPTPAQTPISAPTLDPRAQEAKLYQEALSCMRKAAPLNCDIDFCLTPYRGKTSYVDRYGELRAELARLTERCNVPAPAPKSTPTTTPSPTPTVDRRALEAEQYQSALSCLRREAPSSCSIDWCLTPYRVSVTSESRYGELRAELARLTERCNTPDPAPKSTPTTTPLPTPTVDRRALEAEQYQSALSCLRREAPSSCSIDWCLTPYRVSVTSESRYGELRAELARLTERCNTPDPAPKSTPPAAPRPSYVTYENRDIDRGDLRGTLPHLRDVDQSACQTACNNDAECVGYSYGKWDRACYLKGSLPDLRFEPNSTSAIRTNQSRPPDFSGARKIEPAKRSFTGNMYSTSSTSSRQACANLCQSEDACLVYQYVGNACSRFDRVDYATKDDTAQAGIKRQPAP
ncbi:protein kinase [Bradyrhizobium sp. 180]|uniref:protein kinase domain-containing protein n=1 Tax=Bradyrhizobium sp. 180 TaxID=2782650 RepID=UPI001FF73433|nr:protein kinase [Bradyrhizobium sp. 180]MCK1489752.1 protein kinase [Bradyrhizobium sp. 180]